MMYIKCEDCLAWQREGADGICGRDNPKPKIMEAGQKLVVVWPKTNPFDGCTNGIPHDTKRSYTQ